MEKETDRNRIVAADELFSRQKSKLGELVTTILPIGQRVVVERQRNQTCYEVFGEVVGHSTWEPTRVEIRNVRTGKRSHFYAACDVWRKA